MADGGRAHTRAAGFKAALCFPCGVGDPSPPLALQLCSRPLLSPLFLFTSSPISNIIPGEIVGERLLPAGLSAAGSALEQIKS